MVMSSKSLPLWPLASPYWKSTGEATTITLNTHIELMIADVEGEAFTERVAEVCCQGGREALSIAATTRVTLNNFFILPEAAVARHRGITCSLAHCSTSAACPCMN